MDRYHDDATDLDEFDMEAAREAALTEVYAELDALEAAGDDDAAGLAFDGRSAVGVGTRRCVHDEMTGRPAFVTRTATGWLVDAIGVTVEDEDAALDIAMTLVAR